MTPSELLCQPLMMQESAVLSLIDETVRAMLKPGQSSPQGMAMPAAAPLLEVAIYDEQGQRLMPQVEVDQETGEQRVSEVETEGREPKSLIAVVPLSGVMTRHGYRGWWSSRPGTVDIGRALMKLNRDPAIHTIILQVSSPGGSVTGTPELSQCIYEIREEGETEILSVVDDLMASAATYAATAAKRVYSIPSAYSGSVGTLISYTSYDRMLKENGIDVEYLRTPEKKNRFTGVEPMTEDMRDTLRDRIESSQAWFIRDMARNRNVSEAHVNKQFGQGEVMRADEAVDARLIDEIASLDDVVLMQAEAVQKGKQSSRRRKMQQRMDDAVAEQKELETTVGTEG
ncbi:MAG: S49 family peptidase [Planctomycetota bacterium]